MTHDRKPLPRVVPRRFILHWGWLRIGPFNFGWWSPWDWRMFSIREGLRGKRLMGWTFDIWRTERFDDHEKIEDET